MNIVVSAQKFGDNRNARVNIDVALFSELKRDALCHVVRLRIDYL